MRKVVLTGFSFLALSLSGCGQPANEAAPTGSAASDAAPQNAPGVSISDAMIRLPAAPGRPGVGYFTVSQSGGTPHAIAAAHVEGVGRTEMHETVTENGVSKMQPAKSVPIEPGKTVQFKAGGLHLMLFEVADTLKAGETTEITLTLDNGDKISAPVKIESVGGGMDSGMDHSEHDMSDM